MWRRKRDEGGGGERSGGAEQHEEHRGTGRVWRRGGCDGGDRVDMYGLRVVALGSNEFLDHHWSALRRGRKAERRSVGSRKWRGGSGHGCGDGRGERAGRGRGHAAWRAWSRLSFGAATHWGEGGPRHGGTSARGGRGTRQCDGLHGLHGWSGACKGGHRRSIREVDRRTVASVESSEDKGIHFVGGGKGVGGCGCGRGLRCGRSGLIWVPAGPLLPRWTRRWGTLQRCFVGRCILVAL